MQAGGSNDNQGSNNAGSCTYVCVNSTETKYIKDNRKAQRKKRIVETPRISRKIQQTFWARGYYCETVGKVKEKTIVKYIAEQYEKDRMEG